MWVTEMNLAWEIIIWNYSLYIWYPNFNVLSILWILMEIVLYNRYIISSYVSAYREAVAALKFGAFILTGKPAAE